MALDKDALERLLDADWPAALRKALKQAVAEAKVFQSVGLNHLAPEDLVNEARARLLSGARTWDNLRYPDLGIHLSYIIRSIASHERRKLFGMKTVCWDEADSEPFRGIQEAVNSSSLFPNTPNPEELAAIRERLAQAERRLNTISQEDEEIGLLLMCFQDGIVKPSEIAGELNWEVARVNNALKRMRRKIRDDCLDEKTQACAS